MDRDVSILKVEKNGRVVNTGNRSSFPASPRLCAARSSRAAHAISGRARDLPGGATGSAAPRPTPLAPSFGAW